MSWIRRGAVSATHGSRRITGNGATAWASHQVAVKPGHMVIVPTSSGVDIYEVGRVVSDTDIDLVEPWRQPDTVNSEYAIDTALTDSPSEYAQRIAAMFAYYQSQLDTLDHLMTGQGAVTLTRPDGTNITVPSHASVLASVAAAQAWFDKNLPIVEKAADYATEAKTGAQTATNQAGEATHAADIALAKASVAMDAATKAQGHETRAANAAQRAEELVDQATGGSLLKEQNLADLTDAARARANLNVWSSEQTRQAIADISLDDLDGATSGSVRELQPAVTTTLTYHAGQLTQMTETLPDGQRVTAYTYEAGRLTQAIETYGQRTRTTTYSYDATGSLTGTTMEDTHA